MAYCLVNLGKEADAKAMLAEAEDIFASFHITK